MKPAEPDFAVPFKPELTKREIHFFSLLWKATTAVGDEQAAWVAYLEALLLAIGCGMVRDATSLAALLFPHLSAPPSGSAEENAALADQVSRLVPVEALEYLFGARELLTNFYAEQRQAGGGWVLLLATPKGGEVVPWRPALVGEEMGTAIDSEEEEGR